MTKLLNGIKQKQYRTKEDGNKFGDDDKLKEHLNKLLVVANQDDESESDDEDFR